MAGSRNERRGSAPVVLVLSGARKDAGDAPWDVPARQNLTVERVRTTPEAEEALWRGGVSVVVVGPDVGRTGVDRLLAALEGAGRSVPVLVLRRRGAKEPASWARQQVGVLRHPVLPEVLSRSIDVVLGLVNR